MGAPIRGVWNAKWAMKKYPGSAKSERFWNAESGKNLWFGEDAPTFPQGAHRKCRKVYVPAKLLWNYPGSRKTSETRGTLSVESEESHVSKPANEGHPISRLRNHFYRLGSADLLDVLGDLRVTLRHQHVDRRHNEQCEHRSDDHAADQHDADAVTRAGAGALGQH